MRLGQLARKLALRPATIVEFLSQHQISIESGGNTRLEDEHVSLILHKFAPELTEEKIAAALKEVDPDPPAAPIPPVEQKTAPAEILPAPVLATEIEVIKAPKVELAGLKVLGKIELPEIKKKEVTKSEGTAEAEPSLNPPTRRTPPPRRDRPQFPPRKNPVALQREREAREAEEQRKNELERLKEKKSLHYLKKVKAAPPTKKARFIDEPVEEFSQADLKEPPKTWWGKFMRWLNT